MILETLQSANKTILASLNAMDIKQAKDEQKKQLTELEIQIKQIEQLLGLIEGFQGKQIAKNVLAADDKKALLTAINECGQKTSQMALDAGTVASLKYAVRSCNNAISDAWKNFTNRECKAISETLTSLKSLLDPKQDIDKIIGILNNAQSNVPKSVKDVDNIIKTINKGKTIINDMDFESDPEISMFIKKVNSQSATVADLSSKVQNWLKDKDLETKIRLRF